MAKSESSYLGSALRGIKPDPPLTVAQWADKYRMLSSKASAEPGQGARITAPQEWLDRLLGVLLDNACRYSPDGAPIEVRVEVARGWVRLAVDDAGPGIPQAERRRIFDRFHRSSDVPGGTGLGLPIADTVVRATRGRWEIGASAFGGASMGVAWPAVESLHRSVNPAS